MPMELAHIDVAEIARRTLESGARPAAADSRVMVHCCFSIDESERIGLEHSIEKVQCGDAIVVLGLRADIEAEVARCEASRVLASLGGEAAQTLGWATARAQQGGATDSSAIRAPAAAGCKPPRQARPQGGA